MKILTFTILLILSQLLVAQEYTDLLLEDFSDNSNNWITEADKSKVFAIENGKYTIQNKLQYNSVSTRINLEIDQNSDFQIETSLEKVKGYGLVWGRNKADYYGFYITGGGEYLVLKWENNQREFIIGQKPSSHINKQDTTNKLSIIKKGNKQGFYINDNLVEDLEFLPFFGNEIGFANGGKLTASIDYLHVKQIKKEKTVSKRIKSKDVILLENFEDNSNSWPEGKLQGGQAVIENNCYILENKNSKPFYTYIVAEIPKKENFFIETEIENIDGEEDDSYCISWGANDATNEYYAFRINSFYGSYEYYRIREGEIDKLIETSFTPYINKGKNVANTIIIKKIDNLLEFYVNDKKINDFRFQPFFGSKIGFVTHFEHKISVKNIDVKYIVRTF